MSAAGKIVASVIMVANNIGVLALTVMAAYALWQSRRRVYIVGPTAFRDSSSQRVLQFRVLATLLGTITGSFALAHWFGGDAGYGDDWCAWTFQGTVMGYVTCKASIYYLLFAKSRLVRPFDHTLSKLEMLALAGTAGIVPLAAVGAYFASGHLVTDGVIAATCAGDLPFVLVLFLLPSDLGLSIIFLFLFIQPVRQLAAEVAARNMLDNDSLYRDLLRRNLLVCLAAVACTLGFLAFTLSTEADPALKNERVFIPVVGSIDVLLSLSVIARGSSGGAAVPLGGQGGRIREVSGAGGGGGGGGAFSPRSARQEPAVPLPPVTDGHLLSPTRLGPAALSPRPPAAAAASLQPPSASVRNRGSTLTTTTTTTTTTTIAVTAAAGAVSPPSVPQQISSASSAPALKPALLDAPVQISLTVHAS